MRISVLFGSIVVSSLALVIAACSSNDTSGSTPTEETDSGKPKKDGGSIATSDGGGEEEEEEDGGKKDGGKDGGSSSGGLPTTLLKGGDNANLLGVANDHVIYYVSGSPNSIEAVPLAGGASVKIADLGANDDIAISGGAVALYTNLNADNIGTLSVWTKSTGLKSNITTTARDQMFVASPDGSRIAFSVNATATSSSLAVTDTATPSATAILTGAAAVNVAAHVAGACEFDIGFIGKSLFAAYCTGTSDSAAAARLYTVGATATTATRLDGTAATGQILPTWMSDTAGTKLLVFKTGSSKTAALVNVANDTITDVDSDVDLSSAFISPDGNSIVYLKGTSAAGEPKTLYKASTGATPMPTSLGVTTARAVFDYSADSKFVLFHSLAEVDLLTDTKTLDYTVANPPVNDLVATATSYPLGFTGNSGHLVYLTDLAEDYSAKLHASPAGGGASKELVGKIYETPFFTSGSGLIVQTAQKEAAVEFSHVDATGGKVTKIESDVALGQSGPLATVKDKSLVYVRYVEGGTANGIYVTTTP